MKLTLFSIYVSFVHNQEVYIKEASVVHTANLVGVKVKSKKFESEKRRRRRELIMDNFYLHISPNSSDMLATMSEGE